MSYLSRHETDFMKSQNIKLWSVYERFMLLRFTSFMQLLIKQSLQELSNTNESEVIYWYNNGPK